MGTDEDRSLTSDDEQRLRASLQQIAMRVDPKIQSKFDQARIVSAFLNRTLSTEGAKVAFKDSDVDKNNWKEKKEMMMGFELEGGERDW